VEHSHSRAREKEREWEGEKALLCLYNLFSQQVSEGVLSILWMLKQREKNNTQIHRRLIESIYVASKSIRSHVREKTINTQLSDISSVNFDSPLPTRSGQWRLGPRAYRHTTGSCSWSMGNLLHTLRGVYRNGGRRRRVIIWEPKNESTEYSTANTILCKYMQAHIHVHTCTSTCMHTHARTCKDTMFRWNGTVLWKRSLGKLKNNVPP